MLISTKSTRTQLNLECQISDYVAFGYITPGSDNIGTRGASSYVSILKEHQIQDSSKPGQFFREFYCENWISPNGVWEIVYIPKVRRIQQRLLHLPIFLSLSLSFSYDLSETKRQRSTSSFTTSTVTTDH